MTDEATSDAHDDTNADEREIIAMVEAIVETAVSGDNPGASDLWVPILARRLRRALTEAFTAGRQYELHESAIPRPDDVAQHLADTEAATDL